MDQMSSISLFPEVMLSRLKPEQLIGLLLALTLHGAALYSLWSLRIIPTPAEAATLFVSFINPALSERPKPPEPPKRSHPVEPPRLLAVEAAVVLPNEPVVPAIIATTTLPPPAPLAEPAIQQPVTLSGELSVSCPERTPPAYPVFSMRANEQGLVVLRVELGMDGRITGVTINKNSGYARLDDAAVSAVRNWRCKPAMRSGIAVPAVALQPFNFVLKGN